MKFKAWITRLIVRPMPLVFLVAAIDALGWDIYTQPEDDEVKGLIIGQTEFVEKYATENGQYHRNAVLGD